MNNSQKISCYFAAANGYNGFRSYFNSVFSPESYARLYILKGGPGTGKSSIMKKIRENFNDKGLKTETILCSSDPASLDGVIVRSQNKKIAVIDGTAPHQTDPKFPGSVDEIINIGNSWNRDILISQREKIISINELKALHYKKAYDYLKQAGEYHKYRSNVELKDIDNPKLSFLFNLPSKNQSRIPKIKLLSSFGKAGYQTLKDIDFSENEIIYITGTPQTKNSYMTRIKEEADKKGVYYTLIPSPFSQDIIEGIYFEDNGILVSTKFNSKLQIDTNFHDLKISLELDEKAHNNIYEQLLTSSENEFALASEAHFLLEKIYTAAMDFEDINRTCENLILDMENFL